jgi:peptidoglycan/xylan/chitin deacetylase (PgdA/CDA1 family)
MAITFDDGNFSDCEIAFPVLKANNIPATFFWLANDNEDNILNSAKASTLVNEGFTIGSHGISHCDLTRISSEDQMQELSLSKKIIGEKLNVPVDFFAFPYGLYNKKTIKMAETAGYKAVFTTDGRLNHTEPGRILFHRWSVKRTITLDDFEKRIINRNYTFVEFLTSELKRAIKLIIGQSATDRLNVFIHSGKL